MSTQVNSEYIKCYKFKKKMSGEEKHYEDHQCGHTKCMCKIYTNNADGALILGFGSHLGKT